MGNITYQKAYQRQQKKSYKCLTEDQKKYIKTKEVYDLADKELNRFYSMAARKENGNVNFDTMDKLEIDLFEHLNKKKDKAYKTMSKLEDIIDIDYTLNIFMQVNIHSMSF